MTLRRRRTDPSRAKARCLPSSGVTGPGSLRIRRRWLIGDRAAAIQARADGDRPPDPRQAFAARPPATPTGAIIDPHYRVRTDTIDKAGSVTLRYRSRLHQIGLGKRLAGTKVTLLAADREIRVLTRDGQLIRAVTLDPTRDYQPRGVKPGPPPKTPK